MNDLAALPAGPACMKQYDRAYFERWYRRARVGLGHRAFLERKVALAVAAAEYVLGRRIRRALDVGCGEAPWRAALRRLRPGLAYTGVDPSAYVVARYGRARDIRRGGLADLASLGLAGPYDLVICADVLHYVPAAEARAGLAVLARLVGGAAFIEAFTSADAIEGDRAGFQQRSPAVYRRLFQEAGLVPLGLHVYVTRAMRATLVALERGSG